MSIYENRERRPVETITWEHIETISRELVLRVAPWTPELILAIVRGGLIMGTMLSYALRRELYPIRLTRRIEAQTVHNTWIMHPPTKVYQRRVLIVDGLAATGHTLQVALERVREMGALDVRTASLYAHSWADPRPYYVGLISDSLLISPWEREVLHEGAFIASPEHQALLDNQPPPAA